MAAEFTWQPIIGRPGQTIRFVDLSTRSPISWSWTFYDADAVTVLGTSTERAPIFTWAVAGRYRVHLDVVETGVPTSPPPVDPGNPDPPPTFPPTDPPVLVTDTPPTLLLAGRSLGVNTEFALGIPTIWTVLDGPSGREGTIQTWDNALTSFDVDGLHLAFAADGGGVYRSGAVEAQLGLRKGLYAWKVTAMPHGPHVRASILLYSLSGDQELGVFEDPSINMNHYYTRVLFPNAPTQPILVNFGDENIVAMDWTDDGIQFYLNWYALGNKITDPGLLAQFAAGTYAVSIHTSVGGPWAGAPDASTDTFIGTNPELVVEWFRHWPALVVAPPPPPSGGATDSAYRDALLAEFQGFASGYVTGGRNGPLYVVRNTNNAGAGSFRDAVSQSNRWIIFDPLVFPRGVPVGINLSTRLDPRNTHDITIDCYGSLPYFTGFGISTGGFTPTGATGICNNWIINNWKHTGTPPGDGNDCLTLDGTDRGVLLHVDAQQGGDGSVDITMTGSGPNPYGRWTWAYSKIGNAQGGKGCLVEDQTGPDPAFDQPGAGSNYPGSYAYHRPSSIWPSGAALDRDCYMTIHDCEFFGTLRNPVIANFGVHLINTYHRSYALEGLSIFGFNAKVRATCPVVDGAGSANPAKGILSWDYNSPGTAHPTDRMRKWVLIERPAYRNGANYTNGSSYTNPDGNQLVIPYTYAVEEVQGDSGAALIARLTAGVTNTRRAGQIDRAGYAEIVGIP